MNLVLLTTALTLRVFFLVLFTGAYIWFAAAFMSGLRLLPPPQRLKLTEAVTGQMLTVTWIFIVMAIVGGALTAYVTEPQLISQAMNLAALTSILSTARGLILALEVVVTLLMVVVNAVLQFIYLPRTRISLDTMESDDKGLKWLSSEKANRSVRYISAIMYLSIANIAIGVFAIALGVLYSHV